MRSIKNPWLGIEGYNCFGCCPSNPYGVKMQFYEDGQDIVCFWKPQEQYQSWVNTLHGGVQSVLLDEICGWVVSRKLQTTGVTSKMETRYLKPVSTDDEYLVLRASIKEQRRNIVIIEASLYNSQQVLCSQAVCTYFTMSPEKAKEQMHFPGCEVEEEEVNPLI